MEKGVLDEKLFGVKDGTFAADRVVRDMRSVCVHAMSRMFAETDIPHELEPFCKRLASHFEFDNVYWRVHFSYYDKFLQSMRSLCEHIFVAQHAARLAALAAIHHLSMVNSGQSRDIMQLGLSIMNVEISMTPHMPAFLRWMTHSPEFGAHIRRLCLPCVDPATVPENYISRE